MSSPVINYAPAPKHRWPRWLRRHVRWGAGLTLVVMLGVFLRYNRPWYRAWTVDEWQTFSAVRTTQVGFGRFCVYSRQSAAPFERADVVDPLPTAIPGGQHVRVWRRDIRDTTTMLGKQLRLYPGENKPFNATPHAVAFVEANAMHLDRPTRTRLAKAIAEANVAYEGYGMPNHRAAELNAARLLDEWRTANVVP